MAPGPAGKARWSRIGRGDPDGGRPSIASLLGWETGTTRLHHQLPADIATDWLKRARKTGLHVAQVVKMDLDLRQANLTATQEELLLKLRVAEERTAAAEKRTAHLRWQNEQVNNTRNYEHKEYQRRMKEMADKLRSRTMFIKRRISGEAAAAMLRDLTDHDAPREDDVIEDVVQLEERLTELQEAGRRRAAPA